MKLNELFDDIKLYLKYVFTITIVLLVTLLFMFSITFIFIVILAKLMEFLGVKVF